MRHDSLQFDAADWHLMPGEMDKSRLERHKPQNFSSPRVGIVYVEGEMSGAEV